MLTKLMMLVVPPYRALQKEEEAITQYIERVKLGSWDEEAFMAAFNIAEIAKKQWEEGKIVSPQVTLSHTSACNKHIAPCFACITACT